MVRSHWKKSWAAHAHTSARLSSMRGENLQRLESPDFEMQSFDWGFLQP